ncbi:MAG: alpha/beta fold hydrolase [Geminicoccaceae bacterium]|nr:alpha/beta fold hydrolase [Geminicoccaceae bacterium]
MTALELVRRDFGGGDGTPLVLCHGLLGSSRNWQGLGKAWGRARRVVAVDMRDHGESPWSEEMDYAAMAGDLAALIEGELGGQADVLGHSMGGKAAMVLALTAPERLRRLAVVDIAPVPYAHDFEGYIKAMQGLDLASMTRRSEADAALAPAVPDPAVRAFLLQNLDAGGGGRLAFRPNLEGLLAAMDAITGWPDACEGRHFDGPALFVRGALSDYVRDDALPGIRALFPKARIETVPDAGHWVHAQAPAVLGRLVEGFLEG